MPSWWTSLKGRLANAALRPSDWIPLLLAAAGLFLAAYYAFSPRSFLVFVLTVAAFIVAILRSVASYREEIKEFKNETKEQIS